MTLVKKLALATIALAVIGGANIAPAFAADMAPAATDTKKPAHHHKMKAAAKKAAKPATTEDLNAKSLDAAKAGTAPK
jgi:hypothetical protein